MLEINKLTKRFGDLTAVNDVGLKVSKGEFFSIIGPNGSGKTTIIKTIAGLLHPTSGEILIGGKSIKNQPREAKMKIGYIPDEPKIWSHITGEEFLYFSGALYGISQEEVKARIPGLLSHFDLKGVEKNYFENYSRGNKQKFTMLAALMHDPELILVDEPIVGLDPDSAEIAMKLLSDFTKKGGSVFLATHTLPVVEAHSDRIGILHEGSLKKVGSMEDLRKEMSRSDASILDIYHNFSRK